MTPVEEKEPATSGNVTSSRASDNDAKHIPITYDSKKQGICQEEIVKQLKNITDAMIAYVYETLSENEQRAWDIGETFARICDLKERLEEE